MRNSAKELPKTGLKATLELMPREEIYAKDEAEQSSPTGSLDRRSAPMASLVYGLSAL